MTRRLFRCTRLILLVAILLSVRGMSPRVQRSRVGAALGVVLPSSSSDEVAASPPAPAAARSPPRFGTPHEQRDALR